RLGASRRLSRSLQTDEHDHIGFALLRREWSNARIEQLQQLLEHGLLDESSLVDAARHLVKANNSLHIVLQLRDETDVHVGLDEGSAHL
ncbi:hypothetical protein PFISCL1PPCAC_11552, partial [Pristionchus fissidentatus]